MFNVFRCACTHVCVPVVARGWQQIPPLITLHSIFWDIISHWTQSSLTDLVSLAGQWVPWSSCLCSNQHRTEVIDMCHHHQCSASHVGAGGPRLRSSCLTTGTGLTEPISNLLSLFAHSLVPGKQRSILDTGAEVLLGILTSHLCSVASKWNSSAEPCPDLLGRSSQQARPGGRQLGSLGLFIR